MRVQTVPSLAASVGEIWKTFQEKYTKEGEFFVASPLSSTPLPVYRWIIDHANEFSHWENVRFVLMDEMLENNAYVSPTDPASYEGFAKKHFLDPLKKKTGVEIPIIKPTIAQIETFNTPIDLLILALGMQGNYANVMPGTSIDTGWHIAHLTPEFRQFHTQQGSQSYEGANFREYGMSLGPQQVLAAKRIAVIAQGEQKRDLTKQLLSYNSFDPGFPLSIIYHPGVQERVVIYITENLK